MWAQSWSMMWSFNHFNNNNVMPVWTRKSAHERWMIPLLERSKSYYWIRVNLAKRIFVSLHVPGLTWPCFRDPFSLQRGICSRASCNHYLITEPLSLLFCLWCWDCILFHCGTDLHKLLQTHQWNILLIFKDKHRL